MKNFKLCYIEGDTAYFTTKELSEQWGDDWNDAPYEHNAETPYGPAIHYYADGTTKKSEKDWNEDGTPKWELYILKYDARRLETPAQKAGHNSNLSVEDINAGMAPWLSGRAKDKTPIVIHAGASIEEFKNKVRQADGDIYILEDV